MGAITPPAPASNACLQFERVPSAIEYPIESIVDSLGCAYFNNTVPYVIAFALWNKVKKICIFGVDYTYKSNMHF